jgi:hypothetical protein
MARRSSESDIDSLYQLPLDDFIAGRNALAKSAGAGAADVKALQKPTVPAWAVNQLYWQKRAVYDDLVERAADLRATHNAALRGQQADLRGAGRAHEEAVAQAVKTTLALLAESGDPVTDATRQAIATTLRSLPSEDPPGRLTRPLQPRGFEMLGGDTSAGRVRPAPPPPPPARKGPKSTAASEQDPARLAAAREAAAAAARAVREAEQLARREEFEAARAARDAEKAQRRLTQAQEALQQAQADFDEAQRESVKSGKTRDSAQARADKATKELDEAREHEAAARKALEALG